MPHVSFIISDNYVAWYVVWWLCTLPSPNTVAQKHPGTCDQDTIVLDGETDGSYSFSDEEEQESSDTSDVETDDQSREFNYTLKLINLMCKTDFQTIELGKGKKLKSLSSLQQFISKKLSTNPKFQTPDLKTVQMGYLEPGHGLKGRKIWIHIDSDVKMMYEKYEKKKSIILWC